MACPHFAVSITKRSRGQSAVASAAYQSGERLFSEYDQKSKAYMNKKEVIHSEIMLPIHAPPEYQDRNTLWNSCEAAEKSFNAQLARKIILALPRELNHDEQIKMLREYCNDNFVSEGMCCDFALHDKGDGNPHAHIMLTMRGIDEKGKWMPKCRKVYDLDENGERIKLPSGEWKSHRENINDWNDQSNCEKWRHNWEKIQNRYLRENNIDVTVSLKSYERQGKETIPTVHEGPSVHYMEKKGTKTNIGNLNRDIKEANDNIQTIKKTKSRVNEWREEIKEKYDYDFTVTYMFREYFKFRQEESSDKNSLYRLKKMANDMIKVDHAMDFLKSKKINTIFELNSATERAQNRIPELNDEISEINKRIKDLKAMIKAADTVKELTPQKEKYNKLFFKFSKNKFKEEHSEDIKRYNSAVRLLHKLNGGTKVDRKKAYKTIKKLEGEIPKLKKEIEEQRSDIKVYYRILGMGARTFEYLAEKEKKKEIKPEIHIHKKPVRSYDMEL